MFYTLHDDIIIIIILHKNIMKLNNFLKNRMILLQRKKIYIPMHDWRIIELDLLVEIPNVIYQNGLCSVYVK